MPTRAGVGGGYEDKVCRVLGCFFGACNGDGTAFEGLAECLYGYAAKLWKLIKEQHTAVCQAHFTGANAVATTYYSNIAGTVVGCPKRPVDDKLVKIIAGQAMEVCDL